MFGLFKREDPDRRGMREEFEAVTRQLRSASPATQIAVGHAVNLANSLFRKSFGTVSFQTLSTAEQIAYIDQLSVMETKLREVNNDLPGSLGFGLFKMWVGAVAAKDQPLMELMSKELSYFSSQGDLSLLVGALE